MKRQFVQVCKSDCDSKPFDTEVKKKKYTFCCEKGFLTSLQEFTKRCKMIKK